jgi:hypothetical protein
MGSHGAVFAFMPPIFGVFVLWKTIEFFRVSYQD